jgi:hypothetical protein
MESASRISMRNPGIGNSLAQELLTHVEQGNFSLAESPETPTSAPKRKMSQSSSDKKSKKSRVVVSDSDDDQPGLVTTFKKESLNAQHFNAIGIASRLMKIVTNYVDGNIADEGRVRLSQLVHNTFMDGGLIVDWKVCAELLKMRSYSTQIRKPDFCRRNLIEIVDGGHQMTYEGARVWINMFFDIMILPVSELEEPAGIEKKARAHGWSCSACTFSNQTEHLTCDMCGLDRAGDNQAAIITQQTPEPRKKKASKPATEFEDAPNDIAPNDIEADLDNKLAAIRIRKKQSWHWRQNRWKTWQGNWRKICQRFRESDSAAHWTILRINRRKPTQIKNMKCL